MSDAPAVHVALASVMSDISHVGKTGKNTQQGYNFRGIDGVLNAVGPVLRKHKVLVLPELLAMDTAAIEVGKNRTLMREVTVRVRYRFVGPAGDDLAVEVPGEAMDSGDKAVSKAMSVAFRTALVQALALPTDEPDPDESTYERAPAGTAESSDKPTQRQVEAVRKLAKDGLGEAAKTVVPSIIEEVSGRQVRLDDLNKTELAAVRAEVKRLTDGDAVESREKVAAAAAATGAEPFGDERPFTDEDPT